jgi:hypothetical protein
MNSGYNFGTHKRIYSKILRIKKNNNLFTILLLILYCNDFLKKLVNKKYI